MTKMCLFKNYIAEPWQPFVNSNSQSVLLPAVQIKKLPSKADNNLWSLQHISEKKWLYITYTQHHHTTDSSKSTTAELIWSEVLWPNAALPVTSYWENNFCVCHQPLRTQGFVFAKPGACPCKGGTSALQGCAAALAVSPPLSPSAAHPRHAKGRTFPEHEGKCQKPPTQQLGRTQAVDRATEVTSAWVMWLCASASR